MEKNTIKIRNICFKRWLTRYYGEMQLSFTRKRSRIYANMNGQGQGRKFKIILRTFNI